MRAARPFPRWQNTMIAKIFIEPHERTEAIEAYSEYLTNNQADQIKEAPETALIALHINYSTKSARLTIIEEG